MKRIVLIILLLLLNLVLKAQVTEEQTWEVYQPGVKLIYEINGCQNNTPEPTGEDYFFCDGPDRVVVKSFGLTHATVYDTTVFEYNNEKYICFSTEVGLSIYNETAKKWRNLPYQVFDDVSSATTLIVYSSMYAGNGKIFFNAKNKGFYTFDLSNSSLNKETFSNISVADEMKKNENTGAFFNSIWSVEEGRSINKFQNNIVTRIPIPNLNPSTLGGFDIGTDDKLYIALKDKGILVFNPNDNSYELITPENSELISAEIKDVDFDDNGNLWIVYGNFKENAGLIKWNAANNTFENFVTPDKNDANPITFDTVEILNNEVWASASKSFFQADEDDFGIFKLSIENGDPVWKHFDQQFFKEKGFSEKLSLNNIREQDGILYLSTQNDGSIKYDGKKWSHYSALRNNIPSGYTKDIKMIAQNKRGGFSFTSEGVRDKIDHLVEFNDSLFTSFRAPKNSEFNNNISIIRGQLDNQGTFYSEILTDNAPKTLQSLNFPNWDTLLNTNDSSRTFYAVEGANKWALQGSSFKGGILTNLETGVVYDKNTSNINFNADGSLFFTESKDGRLWSIFSGVKWYDPKTDTAGELIIPDLVGNNHATLGRLKEILFGANENEIWITASNGVIYMKDGVFKYTISNSDSDIFLSLRQVKLDENNNLYALSDSGLATVSDVNNTSPTINEIKAFPTVSGVGPFFLSYRYLTIDNKGTKWLVKNHNLGYSSIIKFEDDNKGKGITNGALTSTLSTRVSGKAFLDINENGIFDEGLDEGIPNQTLNIKTNTKLVTVSTDNDGNYDFLVFLPNQIYEIAVPSTNGFDYTSDRIHKVSVTDLDVSYSKDIPFNRVDIEGLFVRGATKEGAWGFDRGGFDNNFITVVGNLSFAKTFTGVKLTYQFINTNKNREDYNNPSISSIKLFKVKNNVDDHIIDKIRIKSGREQDWYVNADETTYTKVELASPIFIETTEDKNLTLEIDLGDINPAEVYVLEIETEVFDPVAINDVIQFGPTAICATNFASSNLTVNQECIDISATSDDVRGGSHSDFSTYEEPEVIFEGEEDVTPDPKDVYTDGPFLVPIFSSYDPNDKLVSPGVPDRINETDIQKKWLTYTVRFQNNGNFSAKDVVVLDTIDVDFDRYSFRFIEASHKLKIEEVGTTLESIKKFKFENIFLPDSLSDPDGSQGYFKYSIKAKKDIPENTLVENTAYIYFDQNPAIITNTIQNNFKTPAVASVEKYALREELYLYPNPATSKVTISLYNNATIDKVEVYGILGDRIITQKGINKSKIEIDVSILSTGIYFIKANAEGKIISKKLLIK